MTNITKAAQDALDRMDALINPANKLLAIPSHSATQLAAFADMATIRAALQDKASEVADFHSRGMFVARLENMQANGAAWLTVPAVLALLNDCDMIAATHQKGDPV